jgi:hypothetical protein
MRKRGERRVRMARLKTMSKLLLINLSNGRIELVQSVVFGDSDFKAFLHFWQVVQIASRAQEIRTNF